MRLGDIFIRGIELPLTVKGVTVLDCDGNFNVYINILLSYETQRNATKHEIKHIKKDHFYDSGSVNIDGSILRCWKAGGHGAQTFLQVLQNSCNLGVNTETLLNLKKPLQIV